MKLNYISQNFKGYDALPLKAIHMEEITSMPLKKEMEDIAQKEGYEIRYGLDFIKWAQDFKMIIEEKKSPVIVANLQVDGDFIKDMEEKYGIPGRYREKIATGGNTYIGKFPNGEKWMLIGEDEFDTKSTSYISKEYGIKEENIFPIPQQNYHIDMFLRPIGYPYILVDSPDLARKKFTQMDWIKNPYDYYNLKFEFDRAELTRQLNYSPHEDVMETLKKAGFIPIEVAGVFGSGINFMNAIVNKHSDGKFSYITNSTRCENVFISNFENEFEKELREKIPNLDKVYFISGSEDYTTEMSNYIMDDLQYRGGGIHCMTMEEPNFEIWV